MKDALDETVMLSDKYVSQINVLHSIRTCLNVIRIVQDLVSEVILEIGALYNASEAVRRNKLDHLFDRKYTPSVIPDRIIGHALVVRPHVHPYVILTVTVTKI